MPDFNALVDSPIVAGALDVHESVVDGRRHLLVDAGERGSWDGARAAADLEKVVGAVRRLWGFLPYKHHCWRRRRWRAQPFR